MFDRVRRARFAAGTWTFWGMSIDTRVAANGLLLHCNGAAALGTRTYTSPAVGNSGFTMQIGARGDGTGLQPNGNRFASVAAWDGVALNAAQLGAIFNATRQR